LSNNRIDIDLLLNKDKLKVKDNLVFDPIRKKYLQLTPEEFVRQLMLSYLVNDCKFSINRINVEKSISVGQRQKRYDLVIFNKDLEPFILVECKSHLEHINEKALDQIATYNLSLKAPYLILTNGHSTYCIEIDHKTNSYRILDHVPACGKD